MSPSKRYAKKQAKARQRRRLQAHERLERDRRQAQRAAEALHQALEDLGLPDNLVAEIEGRLRSQQQAAGQDHRGDVPRALWLPYPLRAVSRAGLGQELALTPSGGSAQTLLAQAAAALRAGGVGAALAPCGSQESGHPESLAVDLGER